MSVGILVETEDGAPITTERYVAVVAVDKPWSEPAAEVIVPPGGAPPALEVPPGAYRVMCSAADYGFAYLPPQVRAEPGISRTLECKLRKLTELTGRVVAAAGDGAVAGAVLVPAFLRQPEFPFRLSPAGMAHLERNFLAPADAEGNFNLHGVPKFKTDVWVTAPGFGPALLPDVTFGTTSQLPTVKLSQGGALELHLGVPAGFPAAQYLVGLREPGAASTLTSDHGKKAAAQEVLFSPLSEERESVTIYPALPAAAFEIWLKPRQGSDPGLEPLTLGLARIRAGAPTSITLQVPTIARPSSARMRELRLFIAAPQLRQFDARKVREGIELIAWKGDAVATLPVRLLPVSGGLRVLASVVCDLGDSYIVRSDKLLAEPIVATSGCDPLAAELALHPRAEVKGQLRVPVGMPRPKSGAIEVAICAQPQPREIGSYPAFCDASGRWQASVAAGCSDLTLRTKFAPATWRGIVLQPNEHRDLGEQRLDAGSSLLTRVTFEDGQPAAGVLLELIPESELDRAVVGSSTGQPVKAAARLATDPQGWARFQALPAGAYSVHAVPKTGIATFSDLVTVRIGEEALLDDLVLPQPANVEITVVGSLDRLPAGSALNVQAAGAASCGWWSLQRAKALLDPAEHKAHLQLHPGPWVFQLVMTDERGRHYELSRQREEIPSGGYRRVQLEAGHYLFHGSVTLRDKPVASQLILRSRKPEEQFRLVADTDSSADGTFSVFLEAADHYSVEVFPKEGSRVSLSDVAFDDADQSVDLHLPDASISGVVADGKGQSIAAAEVRANRILQSTGPLVELVTASSADGSYLLDNLEAGEYAVVATSGEKASDPARVTVMPSAARDGIDLTVNTTARFRGTVVASGQPVAGVRGTVMCLWSDPQNLCGGVFLSGQGGDFSLVLQPAPDGAMVNVVVSSPGLPLAAFRLPVGDDPVTLVLPDSGGRVRVIGPPSLLEYGALGYLLLVNDEGAVLPLNTGQVQTEQSGDTAELVLPSLAPGHWSLFQVGTIAAFGQLISGGAGGAASLSSFEVVAGSSVDVTVPMQGKAPTTGRTR
jgi:hypothetical protein